MIVSHEHRVIFMRTEKTASSSIAVALAVAHGRKPQFNWSPRPDWGRRLPGLHGALTRALPDLFGLHPHATAAQARRVLGPKVFDGYFKFAVERDPWDRQLSLYEHRCWKTGRRRDFDRDMLSPLYRTTEHCRLRNFEVYAIGSTVVADRVLAYERLEAEMAALWPDLRLPAQPLPRERGDYRESREPYQRHYSPASRDLVARWYAREIAAFGYRFDGVPERE